jgi:hypothetical protein
MTSHFTELNNGHPHSKHHPCCGPGDTREEEEEEEERITKDIV